MKLFSSPFYIEFQCVYLFSGKSILGPGKKELIFCVKNKLFLVGTVPPLPAMVKIPPNFSPRKKYFLSVLSGADLVLSEQLTLQRHYSPI